MNENILKNNIEKQIRNNYFKSKEELYKYILKSNELGNVLIPKDIEELLKLYDELNIKNSSPLDMKTYSNKTLEDKNFIVSEESDRILKTQENSNEFITEFKQVQNQILAYNQDGNVNAKEVFNKLADTQKEEITLIPIYEAIEDKNINTELMYKIKFLISKISENPYSFKVDINNEIFYNPETNAMYEVRKNEQTNQYEIYVSGELKYDNTNNIKNEQENIQNDHDEEVSYEQTIDKPKVRKLERKSFFNNAAFTNIGFLLISITTFMVIGISIAVTLIKK